MAPQAVAFILSITGCLLLILSFVATFEIGNRLVNRFLLDRAHSVVTILSCYIGCFSLFVAGMYLVYSSENYEAPPPIKLIILDIDGMLDSNANELNTLVSKHNAKLLVHPIKQAEKSVKEILLAKGVKAEVVGITPRHEGLSTRDDGITDWLSRVNYNDYGGILLLDNNESKRFSSIQVTPFSLAAADEILSNGMPENFDIGKVSICESKVNSGMNFGGHRTQKRPYDT